MVESLSELIGSESPEMPVPADVVSYSKDVEMEAIKSEVLLGDITGTSSPRVSSSFTPKHDSNFDISFTDTGMYVWIWWSNLGVVFQILVVTVSKVWHDIFAGFNNVETVTRFVWSLAPSIPRVPDISDKGNISIYLDCQILQALSDCV